MRTCWRRAEANEWKMDEMAFSVAGDGGDDGGGRQPFNALVGPLNTADGRVHYINAGQALPLLMRNEGRYERLDAPVHAPLGMNQNVSYRTMDLRLKQGDRLLFHTGGLGLTPGRATRPRCWRSGRGTRSWPTARCPAGPPVPGRLPRS